MRQRWRLRSFTCGLGLRGCACEEVRARQSVKTIRREADACERQGSFSPCSNSNYYGKVRSKTHARSFGTF